MSTFSFNSTSYGQKKESGYEWMTNNKNYSLMFVTIVCCLQYVLCNYFTTHYFFADNVKYTNKNISEGLCDASLQKQIQKKSGCPVLSNHQEIFYLHNPISSDSTFRKARWYKSAHPVLEVFIDWLVFKMHSQINYNYSR